MILCGGLVMAMEDDMEEAYEEPADVVVRAEASACVRLRRAGAELQPRIDAWEPDGRRAPVLEQACAAITSADTAVGRSLLDFFLFGIFNYAATGPWASMACT